MLRQVICGALMMGLLAAGAVSLTAQSETVPVIMKTSKGDLTIELYPDKAPATVANFLKYVDEKFYDGTIFHRVIPDFMIQGGAYTANFQKKEPPFPFVKNESLNGLKNEKYTLAAARMGEPHTHQNQFFINNTDNPGLDFPSTDDGGFGYCVFGKVIEGTAVIDAISALRTMMRRGMQDVPRETVTILSVRRK